MTDATLAQTPPITLPKNRVDKLPELPARPDAADAASAQARLELSRARVRSELMAIAHPPPRPSSGG